MMPLNGIMNVNPLNANFTKWPNTLKQFVVKLPTNCLSVFAHFVGLAFKELNKARRTSSANTHSTDPGVLFGIFSNLFYIAKLMP